MIWPGRETTEALESSKALSGTAPANPVFERRCDQVMNHKALAPSSGAKDSVSHGHDLEIPMALWRRDSRLGHELRLDRLDPDGCVARTRSKPTCEEIGLTSRSRTGGTATPEETRGVFSSSATSVYLTGTFLWVRLCASASPRLCVELSLCAFAFMGGW